MAGSPLQDGVRTVTRILQALASNQALFEENVESSLGRGSAIDNFIQQDYPEMEVIFIADDLRFPYFYQKCIKDFEKKKSYVEEPIHPRDREKQTQV